MEELHQDRGDVADSDDQHDDVKLHIFGQKMDFENVGRFHAQMNDDLEEHPFAAFSLQGMSEREQALQERERQEN